MSQSILKVTNYFILMTKIKESIDIFPIDLPREITKLKLEFVNNKTITLFNSFKNELIYKLLEEYIQFHSKTIEEVVPEKVTELNE